MAATVRQLIQALNADAPAPAGTWTSAVVQLRRDTQHGMIAYATVCDFFLFCETQAWVYRLQGSEAAGGPWFTLFTANGAGHTAGGPGALTNQRIPSPWFRVQVDNAGAGAIPNFRVWASLSVL